ncbi:MAG: type II secretion system protein [Planctomycetes bacterium]|nr:type II secretion system protein [Planctomycetota bacterium]
MNDGRSQQGFTLLEVAIAMMVLAILSFGVMYGFTMAAGQDRDSYELQRAQNHAVSLIEQAESFDYATLFSIAGQELTFEVENMHYSLLVTQIEGDLLAIEATVSRASDGAYAVTLTTLRTMKDESL